MRFRSPVLALLLLVLAPASAAVAAPWAEPPFLALGPKPAATCLTASGGDRIAHAQEVRGDFDTAYLLRVAPDGALAPDGSVRFGLLTSCPEVATAASGAAVAVATPNRRGSFVLLAATREPGAAFSAPQPIATARGEDVDDVSAAVAADGAAVVAWVGSRGRGDDYRERLHVVRRPAGGPWGAVATLASSPTLHLRVEAGIDDAGRATVAWARPDNEEPDRIEVATAEPGGGFGAPQRLAPDPQFGGSPVLAVAPDGGVLLAYEGDDRIVAFARAPGDGGLTRVAIGARDRFAERPAVALASGGTALVAWGRDALDGPGSLVVARRAAGAGFAQPELLGPGVPSDGAPVPAFAPVDEFGAIAAAAGADGGVLVSWLEAPRLDGGDAPARVALAAGTASGGWTLAQQVGGPGRSASALAALGAPASVFWTDNATAEAFLFDVDGAGRIHRALPGAVPAPAVPAPGLTLRTARRQAVRYGDPVVVTARCDAACDLRAVAGRDPESGEPLGAGVGGSDGPGVVRLRLLPEQADSIVPADGRPLRITVRASAPGGAAATVARIDARVRNAFVPPPRRPVDVRTERRGSRLVVRWRTRRPARAQSFLVGVERKRFNLLDVESVRGRGRTRFRVVLRHARRARWVTFSWSSTEPRLGSGDRRVRIRP